MQRTARSAPPALVVERSRIGEGVGVDVENRVDTRARLMVGGNPVQVKLDI